jgi:hypothetical protein
VAHRVGLEVVVATDLIAVLVEVLAYETDMVVAVEEAVAAVLVEERDSEQVSTPGVPVLQYTCHASTLMISYYRSQKKNTFAIIT